VKEYYDARAPEYDEWYLGLGRFDGLKRPHWDDELAALERTIASLPPARTLDIACGTAFLTRHLRGEVTGLDQSEGMLAIAQERMPAARFLRGDALELPFPGDSFDRVFTGHFYGHLDGPQREEFLAEARRVASQLVVVDAARRPDKRPVEQRQRRLLNSGRQFEVYKRYFTAAQLADELGGGSVLHEGRWFVLVTSP
jgi:ubiquinone/menaquinone biosynthesis C-methylase UbiE